MKKNALFIPRYILQIAALTGILVFAIPGLSFSQNRAPVYTPNVSDINALKGAVEPLMKISVKDLIAEIPTASGFFFIGCPNCKGGAEEGNALSWNYGMGDKVKCNFCKMEFPNEKFPNNREKVIIAPSGARQVYRFYQDPAGKEHFFEAHAWYDRWKWINSLAPQLATVWFATKDNEYGDRAAAIAGRFAQVFPDYAVRHDIPYAPKKFYPANQKWPYEGVTTYRGAKWDWWGYLDIPVPIINVYDILKSGYDWKRMDAHIGPQTDKLIERDLFRMSYDFTAANPEAYTNMSPGMYRGMIRLGRVIKEPSMVHEAVGRFRELVSRGFFADGWWKEGSVSYHHQTVNSLRTVNDALKGYTDPPDWKGERFENLDLLQGIPLYEKATRVSREAVLPNGQPIPLNDTWALNRSQAGPLTGRTVSRLWASLGNAALGTGEGENQIMLNVNWSGNYGHSHWDNGSIILFASGKELMPDLGYTHTRYGGWTITTASHNTVVIDQKEQDKGSLEKPVTGHLRFYDDKDPHVKIVDVDASPAYQVAKTYRRRLVMVNAAPGRNYVVDRFDVEGGTDHDWFLHGMAEEEGTLETSIPIDRTLEKPLIPDWGGKNMPVQQKDTDPARVHPYVYLRDVKSGAAAPAGKPWTATWRYSGGIGLRTYNLPSASTHVFRFRSPAIRPAQEDDNKIDTYMRSGIMQRNSGKASSFLAVHEPFRNDPWIESVQRNGDALVVRYKLNGNAVEDRISIVEGQITVNSSAGWKYNSGTAHQGKVEGLQSGVGTFRLLLDKDAPQVNYIRLDLSDGGSRYYAVKAVQGKTIELVDDPGFTITPDGQVVFHTFPKDKYVGPLNYTLFVQ